MKIFVLLVALMFVSSFLIAMAEQEVMMGSDEMQAGADMPSEEELAELMKAIENGEMPDLGKYGDRDDDGIDDKDDENDEDKDDDDEDEDDDMDEDMNEDDDEMDDEDCD